MTRNIQYKKGSDISDFRKRVRKLYPPNTIEAILTEENGNKVKIKYGESGIIFNRKKTILTLSSEEGIPTEKEFIKVEIISKDRLGNVLISWVNNKK